MAFEPILVKDMTQGERQHAMESLIYLTEKQDRRIKGCTCTNGRSASPTAMTESILITATIDAKQNHDVLTADIPNAFILTDVDEKNHIVGECMHPMRLEKSKQFMENDMTILQ